MPHVTAPRSLFVYYRVQPLRQLEAQAAIEALQYALRKEFPGLVTRLMRRAESDPDNDVHATVPKESTWMEVYEHPQGVTGLCEARLIALAAAMPPGLTGPRHLEAFSPMATGTAGPAYH